MERLTFIPNVFYDIIVFVTPALVLAAGIGVGLGFEDTVAWLGELEFAGSTTVLVLIGGVFVGYEYGRIAEAWSAILVQRPLIWLHELNFAGFNNPDFNCSLAETVAMLPKELLDRYDEGSPADSKWILYFYSLGAMPELGSDLLKRYAWEKLSRNSAFSVAVLALLSLTIGIGDHFDWWFDDAAPHWSFGRPELSVGLIALTAILYVEYFRRNCWNNDLLRKVTPVVAFLAQSEEK